MRIWSLHPRYLDRQGLLACWRETLLAQAVLAGRTRGYTRHPQLARFREASDPLRALGRYLSLLADEAQDRGYRFDRTRIDHVGDAPTLHVTSGQLALEREHLAAKLSARDPARLAQLPAVAEPHPLFSVISGGVEPWERHSPATQQS